MKLSKAIPQDNFIIVSPKDLWPEISGTKLGLISDTHGKLKADVFDALGGSDLILHAGDIVGDDILPSLEAIAPVHAVIGNNDYPGEYGPKVGFVEILEVEALRIKIIHRPQDIKSYDTDIVMFGHTHVPHFEYALSDDDFGDTLLINPGSNTRSRSSYKHTCARMIISGDEVRYFALVELL